MRSANAPTINATVIAANVDWNETNTNSGIVSRWTDKVSGLMPAKNALPKSPKKLPSPEKVSE